MALYAININYIYTQLIQKWKENQFHFHKNTIIFTLTLVRDGKAYYTSQ